MILGVFPKIIALHNLKINIKAIDTLCLFYVIQ